MAVAPSHFASARSNTVSVTINAGDLVLVIINNADNTTPAGLVDSGGNYYSLIASDSAAARGASGLYLCNKAASNAVSVTFTAGHSPSIAVGTFTGATGCSAPTLATGTTNTNITATMTTKVASSYAVALLTFVKTASTITVSAATGTLQTSIGSANTPVNGTGVVTQLATTPGSFTDNVTASAAPTGWTIWIIEVWSATYDDYFGKIPPKMLEAPRFVINPIMHGTSGGPATPVPVASDLKNGRIGTAYSETITAQGGSGAGYTYAVLSGSLPAGTSLNSSTGVISGTPTTVASYSFTIKVTDSLSQTGTQSFTINCLASSITVVGPDLKSGTVGIAYSETISASGGSGGYTFAVTSGSLPTGLSLNTSTGVISGTPTVAATSTFTITATDSSSNTGSQSFSITIAAAASGSGAVYTFVG